MSTAKVATSRQLHDGSGDSNTHSQLQHAKPKRKAPSRPGAGADKVGSSSSKSNAKVKRKTSTSSLKEEGGSGVKARRKVSANTSIREENEVEDRKLRRSVTPRKEQYSHLLDEMVGCGDMVLLEPLTEGNIIENLRKRYATGEIYVRIVYTIHLLTTFY